MARHSGCTGPTSTWSAERWPHLFLALVRQADVPRIRLHDLCHTHASLALDAGVDVKVVSNRLGHASIAITADLYPHVVPAVARRAADAIAAAVPLTMLD